MAKHQCFRCIISDTVSYRIQSQTLHRWFADLSVGSSRSALPRDFLFFVLIKICCCLAWKCPLLVFHLIFNQVFMLSSTGTTWATGDCGTVRRNWSKGENTPTHTRSCTHAYSTWIRSLAFICTHTKGIVKTKWLNVWHLLFTLHQWLINNFHTSHWSNLPN